MRFLVLSTLLIACRSKDTGGVDDTGTVQVVDADGDGFDADSDCDDGDASVNPDADEVCDGVDNDCDGAVDDADDDVTGTSTFYADADGDGYGDAGASVQACEQPSGTVTDDTDCDDALAEVNPGVDEVCDGIDDDCDGAVDDADDDVIGTSTFYADADGDGYGDAGASVQACEQPSGTVTDDTDCDDALADMNPGATEVCDELDDDCDGAVDDDDAGVDLSTGSVFYADADGDGYGDASASVRACAQPSGTVTDATDCDDASAEVNPGALEICDELDDDCDGAVDDDDAGVDLSTGSVFYADADGDGYGDASASVQACAQPSGTVTDATDCDDASVGVNPGATEVCDGIDDDCDGAVDDDDAGVDLSTGGVFYTDADADGYGDASASVQACEQPSGTVTDDTDCDDTDDSVNPDASETCDGVDDDCNGTVDDDADVLGDDSACAAADCLDVYDTRTGLSDGLYWIDPDGTGAFEAWCDMTEDGGGWTLLLSADGSSTYWGNNSSYWDASGSDAAPSGLVDADFHGQAYSALTTDEIRICYVDATACHVFDHELGISLQAFFTDDETYTEYAYYELNYSDTGSSTSMSDYLSELGFTAQSTDCQWLGINDTSSYSSIGLTGDWNGGCAAAAGSVPYNDDLAIGVGLQSCYDANGCSRGGSGHAAGQTRGANGVDDSGVYGPWHVFGR